MTKADAAMRSSIPALFLLLLAAAPAPAAAPITGIWLTENGKGVVTIAPCGGQVCGHLSRVTASAKAAPPNDARNPDPALRKRPMLGLPILTGFVDHGDDWKGEVYNPEEGKTYRSFVARKPDGTLSVKGCWYFLCRNMVWRPAK